MPGCKPASLKLTNPKTATIIIAASTVFGKSEELSIAAVNMVVQKLRKAKIKIKKDAIISDSLNHASINLGGKIHLEKAGFS